MFINLLCRETLECLDTLEYQYVSLHFVCVCACVSVRACVVLSYMFFVAALQGDPGVPAVQASTSKKTFYISGEEEYMNTVSLKFIENNHLFGLATLSRSS